MGVERKYIDFFRTTMMGLLPCPLCGKRADLHVVTQESTGDVYNIECDCGLMLFGSTRESQADIVARWNHRLDQSNEV